MFSPEESALTLAELKLPVIETQRRRKQASRFLVRFVSVVQGVGSGQKRGRSLLFGKAFDGQGEMDHVDLSLSWKRGCCSLLSDQASSEILSVYQHLPTPIMARIHASADIPSRLINRGPSLPPTQTISAG